MFDFSEEDVPKEPLSGKPILPPPPKPTRKLRGRRSLKELEEEVDYVSVPEDTILFQKQYYSISEVAEMFNVNTSLLRHWEGEFGMNLRKNGKGDRFFRPAEVKLLQQIHDLLRRRKFTIEGAKDYLKKEGQSQNKYELIQSLQQVRGFLLELKAHL
ncbi:MAG TPA: MerR family transcriptional regulator [Flavisolibacter sp.]|jgi:DNA-binding transcriptional MerR regulator|nr:MerR family transcriptional regulator [Flavisolibacter sp.]